MGKEVTDQSFNADVIEESMSRPVMVDFWAEWCGPCRMLGPVLEKLEKDYAGRFLLAKINTDHNPETARQYHISGIPAVKLFYKGQMADEFVGAIPESRVKSFIEKNLPDPAVEKLKTEAESDPIHAAYELLNSGTSKPVPEVYWKALMILLQSGGTQNLPSMSFKESAEILLKNLPEVGSEYSDPRRWLQNFMASGPSAEDLTRIGKSFGNNLNRSDLEYFITKVADASADEREIPRDAVLVMFFNLRESRDTVNEYRRKLSAILF